MLVSVIITTYKRPAEVVVRAVQSIITQTYKNWELFVVDDSPNTYEERENVQKAVGELSSVDDRVKYIAHETNQGACVARNTGMRASSGNYIAFLDDDDEWLPEKLEKQLKVIRNNSNIAFVYCGCYFIDGKGQRTIYNPPFYAEETFWHLLRNNFIGGASFALIDATMLKKIGGFDDGLLSCQDLDVWLRLSKEHEVACITEPLLNYYTHDGEQISKNINKIVNGRETIITKNIESYKNNRPVYWDFLMTYAYDCAVLGAGKIAFSVWLRGIRILPFKIIGNTKYLARVFFYLIKSH